MIQSNARKTFRVLADNIGAPDQWFLDEPHCPDGLLIDAWEFTQGVPYRGRRPAVVPVFQPGRELAFNFGALDIPIVSDVVVNAIRRVAPNDVEYFPVSVVGARNSYSILNVTCALVCLDEQRSEFTRWKKGDSREDLIGQYHTVSTIRIDTNRIDDHHVFRLKFWPTALLVSEDIKNAIADIPDLGIVFDATS